MDMQQPAVTAPAPASYAPTQDDLDEMHRVRAVHDLLDLAPDLPQELKWGLLDFARALLDGDGATPATRQIA